MSVRARRDAELMALIHQIHERSYQGTYGAPRIHIELRETYGIRIGRKRVERLMRRAGLQGVQKRRFRCTTRSGAPERFAPDLVQRHFAADRPNALWLADVTYVSTAEGFLYDANTWDFDLKKDGKVVGHVHRVVSADGKTVTVNNTGMQLSGAMGDETLVFDKQ
jgi:putative transposase